MEQSALAVKKIMFTGCLMAPATMLCKAQHGEPSGSDYASLERPIMNLLM